jgi:hypothetical protein
LEQSTEAEGSEQGAPADQELLDTSPEPISRLAGQEAEPTPAHAFGGLEPDELAALTAASSPKPGQLWRDPEERSHRVTILTDRYLIGASINLKHLAEIEAMLQTGQFPRRLLGHRANIIALERIIRLQASPDSHTFSVTYQRNQDQRRKNFTLSSIAQRDEVVEAFKARMGEQFVARTRKGNLLDALFTPFFTLILVAAVTGLLYWFVLDPAKLPGWVPDAITTWLTRQATLPPAVYVVLVGGLLMILVMLWILSTLRAAGRSLVLERKVEETTPS